MSYARNLARLARSGAPVVDNLQDIRDLTIYDGLYPSGIIAEGHTTPGDGGGGYFNIISGQAPGHFVDDDGITVVFTGGDGSVAAVRDFDGPISLTFFAGRGNGVKLFDTAIQSAFAAVTAAVESTLAIGGTLFVPAGDYRFASRVIQPTKITVEGEGPFASRLTAETGFADTVFWQLAEHGEDAPVVCRLKNCLVSTQYQLGVSAIYSEWIQEDCGVYNCVIHHRGIGIYLVQNVGGSPAPRRPQNYTITECQISCNQAEETDDIIGIYCDGGQARDISNITIHHTGSPGGGPVAGGSGTGILCSRSWKGSLRGIHLEGTKTGIDLGHPTDESSGVTMAVLENITDHPTEAGVTDLVRINPNTTAVSIIGIQRQTATNTINDTQKSKLITDTRVAFYFVGSGASDANRQTMYLGATGEINFPDVFLTGTATLTGAAANGAMLHGMVDNGVDTEPRHELTNTGRMRWGDGVTPLTDLSTPSLYKSGSSLVLGGSGNWPRTLSDTGWALQDSVGKTFYLFVDTLGKLRISAADTVPTDKNADGTIVGTQT